MALTVKELMEVLSKMPEDRYVIISPDEEGNNLHQASGVYTSYVTELRHHEVDSINPSELYYWDTYETVVEIW